MIKKVFSVEKFKNYCEMKGDSKERINQHCYFWAYKCDGLTKEEMRSLGFITRNEWMIEIDILKALNKN